MAKCIEKVCWPQRITPGNCVLLEFHLDYKIELWVSKDHSSRHRRSVTLFACAASSSLGKPYLSVVALTFSIYSD